MPLRFTKMQGAGNDFVVFNGVTQSVQLGTAQVRAIADRHFGIGADQILLIEKSTTPGIDFRYRIFNADGDEVEHCGNGARCLLRFVHAEGLTDKKRVRVQTINNIIEPRLRDDGLVEVDMGPPRFMAAQVPFDHQGLAPRSAGRGEWWPLPLGDRTRWLAVASMGNPHAMQLVDDVDAAPVASEGPSIERHPRFSQRVNASFMQILSRDEVRLRVWERGAGETLACGTGVCAAAALGIHLGLLAPSVRVHTRGGVLVIDWAGGADDPVLMTGDARSVFTGEVDLDSLPAPMISAKGSISTCTA